VEIETLRHRLNRLEEKLEQRGAGDLAREAAAIAASLEGQSVVPEPTGGLVTTGEAAELLGIRSVNTVKRWIRDGLLNGYQRGGRLMVSRSSIARIVEQPPVAEQRSYEADLRSALSEFDADSSELPPSGAVGRKPWEKGVGARP
jgi:excisionase family DNA binding protein